jgi:predicted amidohydrolase YtcJ
MKRFGVVPVPQPTQVYRYGDGVRRDHPEFADRMYSSGRFRDAGLAVALSSDAPVTLPDVPLACWSAETRITSAGHILGADGRISRQEAFAGYTIGGAHALRRDDVGTLEVGKRADLVMLDVDPFAVDVDDLPDVRVTDTWVDGHQAWTMASGSD